MDETTKCLHKGRKTLLSGYPHDCIVCMECNMIVGYVLSGEKNA